MRRGMLVFLTAALVGTVSCPRPQRALDHEEVFTTQGLLVADAAGLASTDVPLGAGRNALWCATVQLVWNEFARRYRGELVGEGEPSVDILNRQAVKRDVIDEASCLLISGWVRDGILERIPEALKERFGGLARPRLIPRRSDCREIVLHPSDLQRAMVDSACFDRINSLLV